MAERDGGPAFPGVSWDDGDRMEESGMTLRDYFAGQALDAIYTACDRRLVLEPSAPPETVEGIARAAYRIADAMIAAREGR